MNMPIITIEIDRLRQGVHAMLIDHNKELDKYVQHVIDTQLNQEWVMHQIDREVKQLIENAISEISQNWRLKEAITDVVANALADKFKESK